MSAKVTAQTILLAEDDPFISRMYEIKLVASGYRVITKNNGREAYQTIKADRPDLLVLDLNMPELSGLEILAKLDADGFNFKTTPVVVLTNSSREEDRQMAKRYGAEYLVKAELTPSQVLETIKARLKDAAK